MTPEISEDPFAKWRPGYKKPNNVVSSNTIEEETEENEDPFAKWRPKLKSNESTKEKTKRQATQYASRILERIAGTPGDIADFFKNLITESYEKGGIGFEPGEPTKKREMPENLKRFMQFSGGLSQELPTSKKLEETSIKATKGYTEPKTTVEKRIGETLGDITSAFTSGGRRGNFVRNKVLSPIMANLVEQGFETFGGDKSQGQKAKYATLFGLGMAFNTNANTYAGNQINAGERGIANAPVNVNSLGKRLAPLNREFLHGDPNSAAAAAQLNNIVRDIQSGRASARDLTGRVRAINTEIERLGGFQIGPNERRTQTRNLNRVKGAVYDALRDSTNNSPEFQQYMNGQNAWSTIAQSNRVVNYAKRNYGKFLSHGAAVLFGDMATGHHLTNAMLRHPVETGILIGTTAAIHKFSQVAQRVYRNDNLRGYYLGAIGAALNDNKTLFIQNMQRLDEELRKEEEKKKPPYKI